MGKAEKGDIGEFDAEFPDKSRIMGTLIFSRVLGMYSFKRFLISTKSK
jgi:hypothetical protein